MNNLQNIRSIFEEYPQYKEQLFCRGFLITNASDINMEGFPFYANWKKQQIGSYAIITHKKQKAKAIVLEDRGDSFLALIGNCLNPFTQEISLTSILDKIKNSLDFNLENPLDNPVSLEYINELTGSFFLVCYYNNKLIALTDPAGMLFSCYARINDTIYISSHTQLIADISHCTKDEYTKELEKYPYFHKYGLYFPGDHTQYQEIRRFLQNHFTIICKDSCSFARFYPGKMVILPKLADYTQIIKTAVDILRNTLKCVTLKYRQPAISLTGGMDSKTTLAASKNFSDQFLYYSYDSMPGDRIDAQAANKICRHLNLTHRIYSIPYNDQDFENLEITRSILEHNNGGYRVNKNDVRKRHFFMTHQDFDVEVKSWVSEIARANYCKKFGLKHMPHHLTPRHITSIYKLFTTQTQLKKQTDSIFSDFLQKTKLHELPPQYDESDFVLWEFRYPAWGGITITAEHSYSNEIFIPYNNRILLDILLRTPLDNRITDQLHHDLIAYANAKVDELGITVTNWNETKLRMWCEKTYFILNSLIP